LSIAEIEICLRRTKGDFAMTGRRLPLLDQVEMVDAASSRQRALPSVRRAGNRHLNFQGEMDLRRPC
jgi:hypothetical protein